MKVILSPAKSLAEVNKIPKIKTTQPLFLDQSKTLVDKLKKLSPKKIATLMDISGDLATLNHARFQDWKLPFTEKNSRPAGYMFTGAAYQGLNFTGLTVKEQEWAQGSLRILSGLYGILKPLDLMQPYRLEMGTRLEVSAKVKNLYQFCGDTLRNQLQKEMDEEGHKLLVNAASSEYFKAAQLEKMNAEVITVVFKDRNKSGVYKVNMQFAKLSRGRITRFIIQNKIRKSADLKAFDAEGYYFVPKESTKTEYVYFRD